jgi:glycosyltransferase involved in cell wall biosynthesis
LFPSLSLLDLSGDQGLARFTDIEGKVLRSGKSKVSIGLPVFNGENYLEAAVDSILAQTFKDFELIISDNASTDRTQEICQRYCGRDSRVRYFRSEQNHGAAWNFNRVFELASGEYFKWAAHDDMIAPDFLQKCVAVLDEDPTVVLCHSQVQFINEYE